MSEHENPSEAFDAANGLDLDLDLSQVDTSMPSLAVAKHEMVIQKVEIKPWTKTPENKSIVFTLATTGIANGTKGEELSPGFKQTFRVNLQDNYNPETNEPYGDWKKDVAKALDACQVGRSLNQATLNECVGKVVKANVRKKKKLEEGYSETEINFIEKV